MEIFDSQTPSIAQRQRSCHETPIGANARLFFDLALGQVTVLELVENVLL
jgi:hypothetical protein